MVKIGIDQSPINSVLYEHICLENIKNCTNMLVNTIINGSIRTSLKYPWPPLLKGLMTKFQFLLEHNKVQIIQVNGSL